MSIAMAPGQIIVLNGAPRSGKSTIAAVIQDTYEGLWMNLGVDHFMQMTPTRYLPGIGLRPGAERPDLEPFVSNLYYALYASIASHSRLGLNVVVDVGHHDAYSRPLGILPACAQQLQDYPVLFVGVRCPLEAILERRRITGWNADNTSSAPVHRFIRLWQTAVHDPGIYDLEVDTSILSPEDCALRISQQLDSGPPPEAFQRLAALSS